jgi:hypothetical protein
VRSYPTIDGCAQYPSGATQSSFNAVMILNPVKRFLAKATTLWRKDIFWSCD